MYNEKVPKMTTKTLIFNYVHFVWWSWKDWDKDKKVQENQSSTNFAPFQVVIAEKNQYRKLLSEVKLTLLWMGNICHGDFKL